MSLRKLFVDKVGTLNSSEKVHVLNFLRKHDVGYSKNTNGYLFNLSHLEDNFIKELEDYLNLIISNRKKLEETDFKRQEQMIYYKNLLKNEEEKKKTEEKELYNDLLKIISCGITFEIKKKKKYIQKLIVFDTSQEPCAWNSKKRYKKNSVRGRLCNIMKKIKTNQCDNGGADDEIGTNDEFGVPDTTDEPYADVGRIWGVDVDPDTETFGEIQVQPSHDQDHDHDNDLFGTTDPDHTVPDFVRDTDQDPDLFGTDTDHPVENHELDNDSDISEDVEYEEESRREQEEFDERIKYFKTILASEGYVFSDAVLQLKIEEYI
jgi:hypothetical protein